MERVRTTIAILLTAAVLLFAAQNLDGVEVRFLMWELPANVAVLVLVPFAAGLILARLDTGINYLRRWIRRRRESVAESPAAGALPSSDASAEAPVPHEEPPEEIRSENLG